MKSTGLFKLNINEILLGLIASSVFGVGFSYGDFYLFHLIVIFLFMIFFYRIRESNYKINLSILRKKNILPFFIFFSWYVISLAWTPSINLGLKYIFYIFCGIVIVVSFNLISSNLEHLKKIFNLLSILIILEILISLLESFSSFRMPISSYSPLSSFFGKDPINLIQTDLPFYYGGLRPPTGFHWNTNDLALVMVISLPFFLCNKKIFIKAFGIISISTIIIMTSSRAVFLGLILIYILYLVVVKKKIGTICLIWSVIFFLFMGIQHLKESENPRINELANIAEAITLYLKGDIDIGGSVGWRRELIDNGLYAFYQTKGFGIGAGGTVAIQESIGPVDGRFTSMHNFWIELLVEGGILATFIIAIWYLKTSYKLLLISRWSKNETEKYFSQSLFLSMIAFIPSAVAASSTIYFFPMWLMFGFSTSLVNLLDKEKLIQV